MRWTALAPAILITLALAGPAAAGDFKEVGKTVPLDPNGVVSIETFKGWIDVAVWDRPEVEVLARVEPDDTGRDQARKVQETRIRIEGSGRRLRIQSDYDAVHNGRFLGILGGDETLPFVRYSIRVPKTARLEVKDYKSQSRISGLEGSLDFDTYKGRVEIAGMAGPLKLNTYKGDVRAVFDRFQASRLETYKGEVELLLPGTAGFDLDADLGRRGTLDTDVGIVVKAFDRTGGGHHQASANGGGPKLRLETYKGSFRIRAR
jgi:hypothetical protein